MARPPNDDALRRMLAEARAQYDLHPTDFLEGVLTGLSQIFDDDSFRAVLRHDDQATHAGGRSTKERVRHYYHGLTAALQWVTGDVPAPPLSLVLTHPTDNHPPDA
ncbi:hypothetical protein [Phytohabitans rumicis]|nr:hypothetical protein [Phytohabitans rumicis]